MKMLKKFKSEKEEAEFWEKHSAADFVKQTQETEDIQLSDKLKRKIIERHETKRLLTLRLEQNLIDQAKKIAKKKAIGYQTLMRMWIVEGIQHERARH